jgi:hypothetical protein
VPYPLLPPRRQEGRPRGDLLGTALKRSSSVTYSTYQVAAEVISYNESLLPPVWIEHYPPETTDGASETFELVVFSSYAGRERAPYLGETRLTIGSRPGDPSTARRWRPWSGRRCREVATESGTAAMVRGSRRWPLSP